VIAGFRNDVHEAQPAALSITNATEYGLVYTPEETAALGDFCRSRGLRFHVDGARFANAAAHLQCAPADLTWRAGVDVLSFGFVKNGGLSAEALVFFDIALAAATRFRRKRAGHLLSKGRYLAAQLLAMLKDDLWLRNAGAANAGAAALAAAAGDRLVHPVEANEVFLRVTPEEARALRDQGFDFYDWGAGEARLVVSWDQREKDIEALAAAIRAL
jgi:threonine aldolase